jgi:hypothetical protein
VETVDYFFRALILHPRGRPNASAEPRRAPHASADGSSALLGRLMLRCLSFRIFNADD